MECMLIKIVELQEDVPRLLAWEWRKNFYIF